VIYAGWASALVLAGEGYRRALAATLPLCILGALGNGFSIVACPPPCGGAAPAGDLAHLGSLIFGVWALTESGRALAQPRVRLTTGEPPRAPSTRLIVR
jgi:hypothetical protein